MNIIKKLLEKVDVLYDDKKWGKRIDPDEWNANFKVLEEGHNKLVDALTEQISDIDGAIESVTEEGGNNIKLQYRDNAETLNTAVGHIVSDIDNRYTKLQSDTLLAEGTNSLIKDVSYESNTGVFTITKKDGSKVVIDTVIEKVPASMALKEETDGSVWLVVTNQDGSVTKTNVTSLIEDTIIADSDTVVVSSSTDAVNKVTTYTLNIKPNSLGLNHFNTELVTKFEETQNAKTAAVEAKNSAESYAAQAKQSAQSAGISADSAGSYATNAANSAESAKTSENNASNSASEAAKSAAEAKKYAGTGNTEALVKHIEDKNNPHQVTKEQLGFYISDGEPTGAETGDVWLDTSLNPTEEGGSGTSAPSDWDINDKNASGYVKNRTHWREPAVVSVLPETTIPQSELFDTGGVYYGQVSLNEPLKAGAQYTVVINGVSYDRVSQADSEGHPFIGNMKLGVEAGDPFAISFDGSFLVNELTDITMSISCNGYTYHKLPNEYIENSDTLSGIFYVKDNHLTQETVKELLNGTFAIFWDKYVFYRISASYDSNNNITQISLYGGASTFTIPLGQNNCFYLSDATAYIYSDLISSRPARPKSYVYLKTGEPVTIKPPATSSSGSTDDVLFRVEKNGKTGSHFEVLANGIAKAESIILHSQTANSTKLFKITVDDSGTITATEVSV